METIKGTDTVRLLWSAWDYVMDENMQNEMDIEYRKDLFVLCYIFIFIMATGRAFILAAQSLPAEEIKEKGEKKSTPGLLRCFASKRSAKSQHLLSASERLMLSFN